MLSWPSQSAITAISTPLWSNAIAVPWRITCGETRFPLRLGQPQVARCTALRSKRWMANRESDSPRMLGNTRALSLLPVSRIHSLIRLRVETDNPRRRSRWSSYSKQNCETEQLVTAGCITLSPCGWLPPGEVCADYVNCGNDCLPPSLVCAASIHIVQCTTFSFGNALLALEQCTRRNLQPGPLNTYNGWLERKRQVRKGEKGLTLCWSTDVVFQCAFMFAANKRDIHPAYQFRFILNREKLRRNESRDVVRIKNQRLRGFSGRQDRRSYSLATPRRCVPHCSECSQGSSLLWIDIRSSKEAAG